jgi:Leucine-rich repeat (LRR) protein
MVQESLEEKLRVADPVRFEFKELTSLLLEKNGIREVPDCIGSMQALRALNMSDNQVSTVSSKLDALTNLTDLRMSMPRFFSFENEQVGIFSPILQNELVIYQN